MTINTFSGKLDNFIVGKCTYVDNELIVYGFNGDLKIGRFCSIAGRLVVICGDGYHQYNRITTYPFPFKKPFDSKNLKDRLYNESCFPKTKLVIGHDVWIGEDVLITKNVNIGNGAVIAAKSVVNSDVPPYSIIAGNPAEIVKYRFDKEKINMIQKIKWWDWSIEKIVSNSDIFHLTDNDLINSLKQVNNKK